MARLSEIKTQLQNLKKEGMTAVDYIQKLKMHCNTLTSIGEPVSCKDHLFYMVNGLDKEYNPFVASINNRPDLPSIEKIHSLFLSYEFRLEQHYVIPSLNNVQANNAHLQNQRKPYKPSQYQNSQQYYNSSKSTNQTLSSIQPTSVPILVPKQPTRHIGSTKQSTSFKSMGTTIW